MAEIERIVARIEADTSDLRREMARAQRSTRDLRDQGSRNFQTLNKNVKSSSAGFARLRTVAIAAGAAIGAAFAAGRALGVIAEFQDLQVSLDVVFGSAEAGAAAMRRIQAAAAKTPFAIQDLTNAFITLKSVGIEPTNELMEIFADTASVSTNRLETFNALVRILSRSVGGGLGLEELNQISDRSIPIFTILTKELGLTRLELGEFGKTAEGAQKIVDAMIRGLSKQFGGATAKSLDNISVATSNFSDALGALIVEMSKFTGAGNFFTDVVQTLTKNIEVNRLALQVWREKGFGALAQIMNQQVENADALIKKLRDLLAVTAEGPKVDKKASEAKTKVNESVQDFITTLDRELTALDAEIRLWGELEGAQAQAARELELYNILQDEGVKLTAEQRKFINQLLDTYERMINQKAGKKLFDDTRTPLEKYNLEVERLTKLLDAGAISQDTFNRAVKAAKEELEKSSESAKRNNDLMRDLGFTFESAFEDAVVSGKDLSDVLAALEQDLLRIFIRTQVLGPAIDSLFGDKGILNISGGGGGGGGGGLFSLVGSIFGSFFKKGGAVEGGVQRFATGAVVDRPRIFPMARGFGLVGEAGPEGILPLRRTQSGDLGVTAMGVGGGDGGPRTVVQVFTPPGSQVNQDRQNNGDVERIRIFIGDAAADQIQRPGTRLHRAVRDTFGATVQPIAR